MPPCVLFMYYDLLQMSTNKGKMFLVLWYNLVMFEIFEIHVTTCYAAIEVAVSQCPFSNLLQYVQFNGQIYHTLQRDSQW